MEKGQKGEERLALELLKEVKRNATKWFIISIVELAIILSIVATWFIVSYVISVEDVTSTKTETYDIDSEDQGNAIYNNSGKVDVNGKDKNTKNDND